MTKSVIPNPSSRPLLVVPCLNEAAHLDGLLDQLLRDVGPDALVVVADGGSTDGSREIVQTYAARDARVRLMHNRGRLQSAGVNRAARLYAAGRRWLIRIDAHAGYPSGYARRLIAEAERTGADSVVVRLVTDGRGLFQAAAAAAMNSRLGAGGSAHRVGAPAGFVDHGHHALFDLNAFLGVGGYDESFSHNEDAEFDARLRAAGGRIWLTDAVSVVYHPRSRPDALFRQYFNYGKGRARTALKHRTPLKLRQAAPLAVAPAALMAPAGLELGVVAAAPAALWACACLGGGVALALKTRRPATAAAGPVAMLMHLAWSLGFWTQLARTAAAPFRPAPAVAPTAAAEAAS
jgi:succinoglycan biosynthesis protein ExoA